MGLRSYQIFLIILNLTISLIGLILYLMEWIPMDIYGWGFCVISLSVSFVFLLFEWLEYKYLRDNEIYKAHIDALKHKRYLEFLQKSLLSDEDPLNKK